MAIIQTSKKSTANRYSGADSQPWVVKGTNGQPVISDSFTEFSKAQAAADRYTNETGEFAQAVRK